MIAIDGLLAFKSFKAGGLEEVKPRMKEFKGLFNKGIGLSDWNSLLLAFGIKVNSPVVSVTFSRKAFEVKYFQILLLLFMVRLILQHHWIIINHLSFTVYSDFIMPSWQA